MSAPTALYRRYRPDSFADVIGQEHVTAPLMTALEKNRVNHAYLFSGPRGCGKTTSARILARCLNCAQGPTSHPCGECDSCIELARGGPGSLDVIEIDAASHGGVDDARDLRERATFAPIRDRYKIFIIDEAHMVTSAGFNALLKIVEEPPEHIKFIFATTEPDKVIGTIRSRTHHYPFRLVPPEPLMAYLAQLCEREKVSVAPGVLSLVVRAGGGSVRDSLSVLDQLMAGAGAAGLDYDLAVDLLGYTHASLLDDVVEALAANDSATVFKSVDRVIQTGHDPRRFVEDLLERFRDLIIVHAMPESAHAILRGTPDELIVRMQSQAAQLGAAELSRAADVTNAAFNEMTGATSPRLHLELLGARLLLPGADSSVRGMATRLDQLERRLNYAAAPAAGSAPALVSQAPSPESASSQQSPTPEPAYTEPGTSGGGLAAVRAQLARAKAEAGAEVAARQAQVPSAPETAAGAGAAASPVPAPQATSQSAPQAAQSGQAARTWDDLPTPDNTPAASEQFDSQQPAQQTAAAAQSATSRPAPSQPAQSAQPHASQPASSQPAQPQASQPAQPAQPQASQPAASDNAGQAGPNHEAAPAGAPAASNSPADDSPAVNASGIEVIRRAWPEILGSLRGIRMASWVIVNQNVVPQTFDGRELRVGLPSDGLIGTFSNSGHLENLQRSIHNVLGIAVQILPVAGDAPKASSEPNPKVRTGNTAPLRETPATSSAAHQVQNTRGTAPGPEGAVAPEAGMAPEAGVAPEVAAATLDSWGLPAEAAAPPTSSNAAPSAQPPAAAAQSEGTAADAAAAAPAAETAPSAAPDYWDGPTEPSDPWDEPSPDAYPASDPYQDQHSDTPAGPSNQEPVPAAAPVAHTPPRVSPIAAWTTGWDVPASASQAVPPTAAITATPQAPKRSTLLAEQIAQQAGLGTLQQPPQDWGVSLGQTGRSSVADPGWGSMSTAPDWAQPGNTAPAAASAAAAASMLSGTSAPAQTREDTPEHSPVDPSLRGLDSSAAAGPATSSAARAAPATKRSSAATPAPASPAPDTGKGSESGQGFGSAAKSPLGASPNYPTPTQPLHASPRQAAQPQQSQTAQQSPGAPATPSPAAGQNAPVQGARAQSANEQAPALAAQGTPASDSPQGGAKLSMYQRMANSSAAQAARAHAPGIAARTSFVEDVPSPDDATIEESGVAGQAAVERILGGVLIEERPLN